jgi:hypothetical protein
MGLMSIAKEEGEDHYGNGLSGEPQKCTIPGLGAWHQGMFCQMSNVYHKVEIGQGFEQMSLVQKELQKGQ